MRRRPPPSTWRRLCLDCHWCRGPDHQGHRRLRIAKQKRALPGAASSNDGGVGGMMMSAMGMQGPEAQQRQMQVLMRTGMQGQRCYELDITNAKRKKFKKPRLSCPH
mmetsp:Transcript_42399/g.78432  ORF Transcript_42399/g.78432 Transcript_42399/m.78432 type:complete len:107 (-) Transcript_42399:1575-1895(-)